MHDLMDEFTLEGLPSQSTQIIPAESNVLTLFGNQSSLYILLGSLNYKTLH